MKWPWTRLGTVEEAIDAYDQLQAPERARIEKRLKTVEAEVAAVRDAVVAELPQLPKAVTQ